MTRELYLECVFIQTAGDDDNKLYFFNAQQTIVNTIYVIPQNLIEQNHFIHV